ncbi:MAG: 30S ribosomal protein S6 [Magnetococcales bacterium]|nr:30S ribosomal protein S6 [Magnetococcales bacterium]
MAYYESIIIIRPDLTTEQIETVIKRVEEIIVNNSGKILQTELWGRRQLAYMVKKTNKGYYVFNILEGGGPMIANLERLLMIDEDILKFMNIRVAKPVLDPSPLAPNVPTSEASKSSTGMPELTPEEEEGLAEMEAGELDLDD